MEAKRASNILPVILSPPIRQEVWRRVAGEESQLQILSFRSAQSQNDKIKNQQVKKCSKNLANFYSKVSTKFLKFRRVFVLAGKNQAKIGGCAKFGTRIDAELSCVCVILWKKCG